MMTLSEFEASVRFVRPHVLAKNGGYQAEDEAEFVLVYADQWYIEQLPPNGPSDGPSDGTRYLLELPEDQIVSQDRQRLVALLYEVALRNGLNDPPESRFRYRCPACKCTNELAVVVQATADLEQFEDGETKTALDPEAGHAWSDNSLMICRRCGEEGTAGEFDTKAVKS